MDTGPGQITPLLKAWQGGDEQALDRLVHQGMGKLRRLAKGYFSHERPNHTLQPTALVNEVYLRLEGRPAAAVEDHREFFAYVARLMREILVDHARGRLAAKRGGAVQKEQLASYHEAVAPEGVDPVAVLAIDEALEKLERIDPKLRQIVELRYFGGLTLQDIAAVQGVSLATVERGWRSARRWLARELSRRR